MKFIWNKEKDRSNKHKHGLTFTFAQNVFDDPHALSWLDHRFPSHEERWITLGYVNNTLAVVAHTFRRIQNEENIRIISARKATKKEQAIYFKNYEKI